MQRRREFLGSSIIAAGALLTSSGRAMAAPVTITFLHHNDTYEIAPKMGVGGYAPFATLLQAERSRSPSTIATFGGDLISPSILSGLTKGAQMIEMENAIGTDVAVIGNHELDFGPEIAEERIRASRFPWLGSNVLRRDGRPALGAQDRLIKEVAGFKIGFLGLLTPQTKELSQTGDAIVFGDPVAVGRKIAAELRAAGADLVVALTHLDLAEDRALAGRAEGIDLVLGGHDHEPITLFENDKLILKAGSDLHYLAAIDVTLERAKERGKDLVRWRPAWRFVTTAGVAPQQEIAALVARWQERLNKELSIEVGRTTVPLDSRRDAVRTGETAIGNLIADAIRNATGADLAITNGGGIRGDRTYPADSVLTRKDILTELPFGNVTVLTELTGANVRAALENGVSQIESKAGRFPHVSGMMFEWDGRREAGSRVTRIEIAGRPVVSAATYKVATNDYILGGGDGYMALGKGKVLIDASGGTLIASTVMGYISAMGGTVAPKIDGRIRRVG